MQFALTEEQRLIQESALDWLAGNYDFRAREAGVHRDGGSPAVWSAFAEMGWLGLPLAEDVGGFGAGVLEVGLLMQAFGRYLVVEPFQSCVLQAGRLLALAGSRQQKLDWLPAMMEGRERLALAHAEPGDVLPWQPRRTIARRHGDRWRIAGAKQLAIAAPDASRWIVSARAEHGDAELMFLLDPKQDGIAIDSYDTSDGGRAADIRLRVDVDAQALLGATAVTMTGLLHQVLAEGVVAQCWQATGAMQAVLEQTTAYTQQRKQFGQALSSFQVVQHRLAEMAVHCVEAQAACELASMQITRDSGEATRIAAMVKNKVGRAARYVAQEAVQLHGAMGVCEELPVAATFRLLLAFGHKDGEGASHAQQLGAELLASRGYANSQTLGSHP